MTRGTALQDAPDWMLAEPNTVTLRRWLERRHIATTLLDLDAERKRRGISIPSPKPNPKKRNNP